MYIANWHGSWILLDVFVSLSVSLAAFDFRDLYVASGWLSASDFCCKLMFIAWDSENLRLETRVDGSGYTQATHTSHTHTRCVLHVNKSQHILATQQPAKYDNSVIVYWYFCCIYYIFLFHFHFYFHFFHFLGNCVFEISPTTTKQDHKHKSHA